MGADLAGSRPAPGGGRRWRSYHALALLPAVGMLGGLPFANRVHPLVLGLPFLMAWLVGWVLATSATMWCILLLDRARGLAGEPAADARPESAESREAP